MKGRTIAPYLFVYFILYIFSIFAANPFGYLNYWNVLNTFSRVGDIILILNSLGLLVESISLWATNKINLAIKVGFRLILFSIPLGILVTIVTASAGMGGELGSIAWGIETTIGLTSISIILVGIGLLKPNS